MTDTTALTNATGSPRFKRFVVVGCDVNTAASTVGDEPSIPKPIPVKRNPCPSCEGMGWVEPFYIEPCAACVGTGKALK